MEKDGVLIDRLAVTITERRKFLQTGTEKFKELKELGPIQSSTVAVPNDEKATGFKKFSILNRGFCTKFFLPISTKRPLTIRNTSISSICFSLQLDNRPQSPPPAFPLIYFFSLIISHHSAPSALLAADNPSVISLCRRLNACSAALSSGLIPFISNRSLVMSIHPVHWVSK